MSMGHFGIICCDYWKASLERSDEVLFFKYERYERRHHLPHQEVGEFLEFPFSEDERKRGMVKWEIGPVYITPSMAERMEKVIEEKFGGSNLTFKMSCQV
ncbi:hypothetical protein L1049_009421 [Liquidambar formosana]|uniref:Sulfotransferase n=1 Tax=Liquidambar formosana TaxID=63359 RepID=A0AAP0X8X4_LIQFO